MTLCDNDHEELVYSGRKCPACELRKEVEYLNRIITRLEEEK